MIALKKQKIKGNKTMKSNHVESHKTQLLDNKKSRSDVIMEAYLSMNIPELHRQGLTNRYIYSPRPQSGKGASWMGRKQETKKK